MDAGDMAEDATANQVGHWPVTRYQGRFRAGCSVSRGKNIRQFLPAGFASCRVR
jgi:hypothetical protein